MILLTRFCAVLVILSITVAATAASIAYTVSYDGSYDPYSTTPPSGQSTWYRNNADTIMPTYDAATGIADFSDTLNELGKYVQISQWTVFTEDQSDDLYTINDRQ